MSLEDRIFAPTAAPPPSRLGAFFLWSLNGAWPWLVISAIFAAISGLLEVVAAWVMGTVIDATLAADAPARFFTDHWQVLALFMGFFLLARPLAVGLAAATNNLLVGPNVMPLVLARLFRWTLGQSVSFFDNDFAGRLAQKQMQAARAVTDVATDMINTVAFALASLLGSAVILAAINGWMALGLVAWFAAYLAIIRHFLPKIRARATARAGARSMITGQVVDTITNIRTVKLFAHADYEESAALSAMKTYRDASWRYGETSTWMRFGLMAIGGSLPVMLIGGTLWFWTRGQATPGDIAAAGTVGIRIVQMTGWVSMSLMSLYGNVGEVEDGMRTLSRLHQLTDAPDALALGPVRGEVAFDHVTFTYGKGQGAIADVDLHIRPGERVALVGASGAGKTTLVSLLLRLYDVEAGAVRVDGHDVRAVTQESLRRQIATVTQDTAMFNRSARDNILYGRPGASEEEMMAAARAAEAHEFILRLVDSAGRRGYDAHLGERGVKLSGGQRQRIALARAFLKNAPILVLDEATSALDSEVEAQIQEALDRVMQGKTVIAIAHRLSTIAAMDRIVVLDHGRIAEEGSHADLLARGGLYASYWHRQSGGFLGAEAGEAAE